MTLTSNEVKYNVTDHEGLTRCHCGSKYWETTSANTVTCESCGEDLNDTLPGIKTGVRYYECTDGNPVAPSVRVAARLRDNLITF